MAGIMERIFPLDSSIHRIEEYCGSRFSLVPTTLIIGSSQSMKTAMLMQAAVSEGAGGGQVLFIAPNKLSHLPPSIHGMSRPTSSAMNNIRFLYATQAAELQGYLASIHLTPRKDLPSLIVIDDLQNYVPLSDPSDVAQVMVSIARILSLIQEAGGYCFTTLGDSSQSSVTAACNHHCSILMAWTSCSSDILKLSEFELFAREYCHHVWTVKQLSNKEVSRSIIEYQMMETLIGASCTISFSRRNISSPAQDIVLHQVALEIEDGSEESPQFIGQAACHS